MAKLPLSYTVTVDTEELIKNMKPILENITELRDLVPEWNSIEADELEQELYELISNCIKAEANE